MLNFVYTLTDGWKKGFSGVPALNSSFLFGDGFFETIRMGKDDFVPLASIHASRISRSAAILGFDAFTNINTERLLQLLTDLHLPESSLDWKIKLLFFRGQGSGYVASGGRNTQQILASCSTLQQSFFSTFTQVAIAETVHISPSEWGWMKSTSALPYVLAARERVLKNADELLLCSPDGFVVEGSFTSICWKDESGIYFTPRSLGGVDSCQRRFLEEFYQKNHINFKEKKTQAIDLQGNARWIAFLSGIGIRVFNHSGNQAFLIPDELRDLPLGGFRNLL